MRHTPGPWKIKRPHVPASASSPAYGDTGDCAIYVDGHSGPLAECFSRFVGRHDDRPDECAANARLIAAAPKMAAALERVLLSAGYMSGEAEPTLRELEVSIGALNEARQALFEALPSGPWRLGA